MNRVAIGFLILCCFYAELSLAQEDTIKQRLGFGVQLGLNASRVTGTTFQGINKAGLYSGFFLIKPINDKIKLELDLCYSQKGTLKPPNPKTGDYTKYRMKLEYISTEFYCRYNRKGIDFIAGLGGGWLIGSEETNENNKIITVNGEFSKIEISGMLGVLFPISKKLGIGVLGCHSIVPIRKHISGVTFRLNRGQYNQVLNFIVKYTILK